MRPRSLNSGAASARLVLSRSAAEENWLSPCLQCVLSLGVERPVELLRHLAEVRDRRLEVFLVVLDEPVEAVGRGRDLLAGVRPGREERPDLVGVLGDLGEPGERLVDRVEGVARALECLGRRGQGLGGVGRGGPLDDRRLAGFVPASSSPGIVPGSRSIATSPISDREIRGTEPARI